MKKLYKENEGDNKVSVYMLWTHLIFQCEQVLKYNYGENKSFFIIYINKT